MLIYHPDDWAWPEPVRRVIDTATMDTVRMSTIPAARMGYDDEMDDMPVWSAVLRHQAAAEETPLFADLVRMSS